MYPNPQPRRQCALHMRSSLWEGLIMAEVDWALDERYRLLRWIGKGAFGQVMLAHDLRTDSKVAIKRITTHQNYSDQVIIM